ncbi:ATP-binding protein [Kitasatospora sp. NBC_00374]|uniref:ATP-binding protein n=1 Tax=Kitasatospora sp. NBC_00374 TaxID=2975964 RepID=UPI0030DF1F7B
MPGTCDRPSTPTATHEQASWLPRRRRSAGAARRLLRDFLAAQAEAAERFLEVGELLVSELVANAVEHARTPPRRLILVRFALGDDELRIEVHDAGDRLPSARAATELPDLGSETGRGLFLVRRLSSRWGCQPRPGGVGKTVWCTVTPTDGNAVA